MFAQSHSHPSTLVYGLSSKARCIAPVHADTERDLFLVGSHGLREDNEIHLVEVKAEDGNSNGHISCLNIFNHPFEIWALSPCPNDASLFFTCYNTGLEYKTTLWKTPAQSTTQTQQLESVVELTGHIGAIKNVFWDPHTQDQVVSLDESNVRLWQLGSNYTEAKPLKTFGGLQKLYTAALSPNHSNQMATAHEATIKGWDFRQATCAYTIEKAHASPVIRDLDWNPNRPYVLASAGDDMAIKFWDIRNTKEPIKVISNAHQHWVWAAKHNKLHDQLIISSSSDNSVKLWNVASISSALNSNESTQEEEPRHLNKRILEDHQLKHFEEHEDSVYAVAWGAASIWLFASLSHDGRLVINFVPKDYADMLKY